MFSTWPWLCMVQWGLAVTWEMPWSHTRADTIGFFTICSFLKHGQMGLWSEQHSCEGSGIRQQLTIWCQSGGTIPRQECFCSVYSMEVIHSPTVLSVTTTPSFKVSPGEIGTHLPPLLITLSQSDEDIFYLTSCFHQRWQKEKEKKKKNEATHFLLNSARKILHWTIYHLLRTITRMNKTIKTEEKATLSSSWSTQSL